MSKASFNPMQDARARELERLQGIWDKEYARRADTDATWARTGVLMRPGMRKVDKMGSRPGGSDPRPSATASAATRSRAVGGLSMSGASFRRSSVKTPPPPGVDVPVAAPKRPATAASATSSPFVPGSGVGSGQPAARDRAPASDSPFLRPGARQGGGGEGGTGQGRSLGQDAAQAKQDFMNEYGPSALAKNAALDAVGLGGIKQGFDAAMDAGEAAEDLAEMDNAGRGPQTGAPTAEQGAGQDTGQDATAATDGDGASEADEEPGPRKEGRGGDGAKNSSVFAAAKNARAGSAGAANPYQQAGKALGKVPGVSDETAANMAKGAEIGSKVGSVVPGAGTAVGAAAGALAGANPKAAKIGVGIIGLVLVMVMATAFLGLSAVATMFGGDGSAAYRASMDEASSEQMEEDGVPAEEISYWNDRLDDSTTSYEVAIAMLKIYQVNRGDVVEMDSDSFDAAVESNTPIGPYRIYPNDVNALYDQYRLGEKVLALQEFEDGAVVLRNQPVHKPTARQLLREDYSTAFLLAIIDEHLSNAEDFAPDSQGRADFLDVGAIIVEDDNEVGGFKYVIGDDAQSQAAQEAVETLYVDALSALPTEQASAHAGAIYQTALYWRLGLPAECVTTTGSGSAFGAWANPLQGRISSPYGMRVHPRTGEYKLHDGIDLVGPTDANVHAAGSGVVSIVSSSVYGPAWVKIEHGSGVVTEYGHMKRALVTDGQTVTAGTPVGVQGSLMPAYSTGDHLHFSVKENGAFTDPAKFLKDRGVNIGVDDPAMPVGADEATEGEPIGGGLSGPKVRIIQANIPMRSSDFQGALSKATSKAPDFVSLNEVVRRPAAALTPPGYALWRETGGNGLGVDSAAVIYRADRWSRVASGHVVLLAQGRDPGQYKEQRGASWVTLQSADAGTASFIATHMMTNPAKYGPLAERQSLYREGMQRIADLIERLSSSGPVFLAGDMNSQFSANDPWGPRKMLAPVGMRATFEAFGPTSTHVGGGVIDYIMYQPRAGVSPTRQWTSRTASDHLILGADFDIDPSGTPITTGNGVVADLPQSMTGVSATGEKVTLDRKQLEFAAQIASKGLEMNVPDDGIIIAFMTVLVETKFKNYSSIRYPNTIGDPRVYPAGSLGSDHDSVGLFQQRPVSGWGPTDLTDGTLADDASALLDVDYTASAFFGGPNGPNRGSPMGLLDHPNWQSMSKGDAAQDVQVSAFPDKYAHWEDFATEILYRVKGVNAVSSQCDGTTGAAINGTMVQFEVGTFNVMGNSATGPGGIRPSWRTGEERMVDAFSEIEDANLSIVGLQEMERPQIDKFAELAGSSYATYPTDGAPNMVAWRSDTWTMVQNGFSGNDPYVLLQDRSTGQQVWFMSVQNPAGATGTVRNQVALIERLRIEKPGVPFIYLGDMNDRARFFCAATNGTELKAANGGSHTSNCKPPLDMQPDWIMGTADVSWSEYGVDSSPKENKVSDRPLVTAVAGVGNAAGDATGAAKVAVDYAMAQIGAGYSQAGHLRYGPTHFDCSGLMYMAYKQAGITIGTWTGEQQFNGVAVPANLASLQPGDMIFYYFPISHVGMYIGNGKIVHASRPGRPVHVTSWDSMPVNTVRRVTGGA